MGILSFVGKKKFSPKMALRKKNREKSRESIEFLRERHRRIKTRNIKTLEINKI